MRRHRPAIRIWHRWFGLLAGVWLLLLAITGSVITYYDELDTLLNPDLRRAPPAAGAPAAAPITAAVDAAAKALPGFEPRQIDLANRAGESVWILGSAIIEGERKSVQAFADPATGRLLGWRESGRWSLHRHHLPDLFYGLHVDLLLGSWVTWFFGLVSLLWLVDHAFALALAFPRLALWKDAFRLSGRPGSLRRLYDWHRAPGVWAWPVTLVLALTGVTLAWPEHSRDAVRLVSPVSDRLDFAFPDRAVEHPALTIEQAIARVAPVSAVDSVRPMPAKGVYAVRTFHARDVDDQGRMWTYVDMTDGRIVGRRHDTGEGAGDAFFAWQYSLHSGQGLGEAGRALVFAGGVVTAALTWTGVLLWSRRRTIRGPERPRGATSDC